MRSETAARLVNKHFELLAWIFFVLLLGSGIFALRGTYLYYTTGSCNGMNATGFCVFDPTGESNQISHHQRQLQGGQHFRPDPHPEWCGLEQLAGVKRRGAG